MHEDILTAKLSIIDDMSDTMAHIADIGLDMAGKLEQSGHTISTAFDDMSNTVSSAVDAVDAVSNSAENAARSTDYWTSAADNYNKAALESVYTTEELINMGFKSAEALLEESNAAAQYDESLTELYHEMENATYLHDAMANVIENANEVMEKAIESDEVSAEAKLKLSQATEEAVDAFAELEKAQANAQAAMDDFDRAASADILNAEDLAAAAQRAATASDDLAEAQKRADKAAGDLAKATDKVAKGIKDFGDDSEEGGKKAVDALEAIAETAAFAAIVSYCKSAASAVYELAEAFSEAQQTIVNATGATDEALADMENSMMSAFGTHHADLKTTAGAIGEINTRMGLTGSKLTEVTGKFLDFSQATGSNTVTAVQNVTKVMNKWGVKQEDVVDVLDRLAYAGQISGASVDSLSSQLINGAASFKAMGLSLDTTISLLSAFELQGINSSSAIMGLRTAARKFAADGLEANDALKDTIEKISTLKNESEATSLAVKVFGSRAGLEMAGAIRNGAITVEMLNRDLEVAEGTLQKTTEAGETLSEKWEKASNKFKTAFTNSTQPALDGISAGLSNIVGGIGDFLAEHETLTKVLTAAGVTIGTVVAGITGLTFALNTAIPMIKTFITTIGTTVMANPIAAAVVGITALAAGAVALGVALSDSSKEVADYNGTLEECSAEIENTNLAHERAVAAYGEENEASKQLADQLETLNKQYEQGGGIIEDYAQRAEKGAKKLAEFEDKYHEKIDTINDSQTAGLVMVSQLEALRDKADKTNFDLDLMTKYADYLNDTFECNIKVNYNTGDLTGFDPSVITNSIIQKTKQALYQAEVDAVTDTDFTTGYVDALKRLPTDTRNKEQTYTALIENPEGPSGPTWESKQASENWETTSKTLAQTEATIKGYESRVRTAFANIGLPAKEADKYLDSLKQTAEGSKTVFEKMSEALTNSVHPLEKAASEFDIFAGRYQTFIRDGKLSSEELVSLVQSAPEQIQEKLTGVISEMTQLNDAYEEVYNSAYESYQGQYSLFEKLDYDTENHVLNTKAFMDSTVENAQSALDSQLSYWTQYSENMDFITSYATDKMNVSKEDWNAFVTYLGSGTEEAAGLLNDVQQLLSEGKYEAVEKLVNTQGELKKVHGETADDLAQFETEYDKKMKEFVESTTDAIKKMEIPDEAKTAATKTMNAYLDSIKLGGSRAIEEAQKIAKQIASALNVDASVKVSTSSTAPTVSTEEANATGTLDSADVFIAGEQGPELIVGKQHSTVFPTSETDKILNAVNGTNISEQLESVFIPILGKTVNILDNFKTERAPMVIMPSENDSDNNSRSADTRDKRITIELSGSGNIEVSKGTDKKEVLSLLEENLKPVLMNIISTEIYEEGDDSYEY